MQARPLTLEEIATLRGCFENGYSPYMERDRCLFELASPIINTTWEVHNPNWGNKSCPAVFRLSSSPLTPSMI